MTLISSLRRKRSILDLEIFQMPRAHEIRAVPLDPSQRMGGLHFSFA